MRRHHSLPQSLLPPLLRQFVRVAVVAAAIAAAAAAATAPRPAPDCSRQLSREVRDIVAREVLPVMKLHGVTYAPACVFNVDRDMYAEQVRVQSTRPLFSLVSPLSSTDTVWPPFL